MEGFSDTFAPAFPNKHSATRTYLLELLDGGLLVLLAFLGRPLHLLGRYAQVDQLILERYLVPHRAVCWVALDMDRSCLVRGFVVFAFAVSSKEFVIGRTKLYAWTSLRRYCKLCRQQCCLTRGLALADREREQVLPCSFAALRSIPLPFRSFLSPGKLLRGLTHSTHSRPRKIQKQKPQHA